MPEVIAIAVSDIHLSDNPPVARSAEPDWFKAMERPLVELYDIQQSYGGVPIICGGDVFHYWKASPALIGFAMDYLPGNFYSVAGQHDLPNHQYHRLMESAYGVLVRSGTIQNLHFSYTPHVAGTCLFGFPWNHKVENRKYEIQPKTLRFDGLKVAVVHSYYWKNKSTKYTGADKEKSISKSNFSQFDLVVIGDNHKGFMWGDGIINCGAFIRRNIDEINYEPQIGLLMDNGTIKAHKLESIKDDKFNSAAEIIKSFEDGSLDTEELVKELRNMKTMTPDFVQAIFRAIENCDQGVKDIVFEAITPSIEEG